eukprot:symbB.v1.2.014858.t1/scaffold1095.1/size138309/6
MREDWLVLLNAKGSTTQEERISRALGCLEACDLPCPPDETRWSNDTWLQHATTMLQISSRAESLKLLEVNRGNSYSSVSLESATAQSMVAVPTLDRFGLQAPMPLHQEAELLTDGVI